jgi:CRISPR/Cas system CSM-associated protein Csm5 (group 7 of RAMP superfamily)
MPVANQKMKSKKYRISAECLTSVCVKSGHEIMPWEYVILEEKGEKVFYRFNLYDFYKKLSGANQDSLGEKINAKNVFGARALIHQIGERDPVLIKEIKTYSAKADQGFYYLYKANINKESQDPETNRLAVYEHVQSGGSQFIPGSSIKGALRTVLLRNEIKKGREWLAKGLEDSHADPAKDDFKDFCVLDAKISGENYLRVGEFFRAAPVALEYFPRGARWEFDIIARERQGLKPGIDFSRENIIRAANAFAKYKVDKFKTELKKLNNFLGNSKGDEDKKIQINNLEDILNQVQQVINNSSNEFVLNLGSGGSFWYKSFCENHPKKDKGGNKKKNKKEDKDRIKNESLIERTANLNINIPLTWWHNSGTGFMGFVKCRFLGQSTGQ